MMTIIDMPHTSNHHHYYYLGSDAMLDMSITKILNLVLINLGAAKLLVLFNLGAAELLVLFNLGAAELSRTQTLGCNSSDASM